MNLVPLTFFADAHGDLLRGLQVVETSIGITSTLLGDKIEGMLISSHVTRHYWLMHLSSVSKDMDTEVRRLPLGVCASIAPFNFPAYAFLNVS
jgi:malonate-semialdehyde dehydrogenase (acetylating)/methylmalonate-semialdehyde dehydrogenase